jgi:hypothetical protein
VAVRIGELLLKEKRISPEQLQEALNYQKANGGKLGFNLVKLGFVKDEELTALLSKQYGVPSINLAQFEIDPGVIKLIPAETAHKYQIIPLSRAGATLTIAMTDPTNVFAMDDIKFMTGYNVEPVVASETAVMESISRYYAVAKAAANAGASGGGAGGSSALELATKSIEEMSIAGGEDVEVLDDLEEISAESLEKQGGEAPVIKLVNVVLMSAIQKGASDIHIEPYEKEFRVRYRIDGHSLQHHDPAHEDARRHHVAHQDHGEAGHRGEAAAAGRPYQDPIRRQRQYQGHRFPRVLPSDALRREDRHAYSRQRQVDARHDEARVRAGIAHPVRGRHQQAVGHGAGHGAHGQR